jgi:hypothetical protein
MLLQCSMRDNTHARANALRHFVVTTKCYRKWDSAQIHYQRASHLFKANTSHDAAADRSLLSAANAAAEGRKYVFSSHDISIIP